MRKVKVMIVEDEALIRILLAKILERLNCNVICETGYGEEAVKFIEKDKPDLILMDVRLQGEIDGLKASEIIDKIYNIPIIILSAYDFSYEAKMMNLKNVIGFFEKPIIEEQLMPILEKIKDNIN
jgi:YesN/AraC family two-component response regulator